MRRRTKKKTRKRKKRKDLEFLGVIRGIKVNGIEVIGFIGSNFL